MLTLGIVATIADCRDSIDYFIKYHKAIGFSRFYLFIDDNDRTTADIAGKHDCIRLFKRDRILLDLWEQTPAYSAAEESGLIDKEVMTRQELNFCVAYQLARHEGVDWLLHIDADELFFPNGVDTQTHFKKLQIANFRSITYLNFESISHKLDARTIYHSSSYFKKNFFKNKHWFFSNLQKSFIENTHWLHEKYFNYYQNGKSAVSTYGANITFYDVHAIIGDGRRKIGDSEDPIVLHFPCARFSDFVAKYSRLGQFSNFWRDNPRAGQYIHDIHLRARDFFLKYSDQPETLIEFYRANFLLTKAQIDELMQQALASEIDFHLEIIKDEVR